MAAITAIEANVTGDFLSPVSTLSSSDTITYAANRRQLLVIRNGTAGSLTLKIDGDGGSTVTVPGVGVVNVAGGFDITLAAGVSRSVVLGTISAYCQGVVTLTGGSGLSVQLFNL